MRYDPRRAPMRLSMLACAMLALPGCASVPSIYATQGACSSLLPSDWLKGVNGAPLPAGNDVGDWITFGDAQTAQLDKANGRYVDGFGIIGRCEARDRAAIEAARKRWWQIWK